MLRLAIFDLDGTLKEARDPYVYLHSRLGTLAASEAFFADGFAGRISYAEWLRLDAALWKGTPLATLQALFRENPYLPGAEETVRALKRQGVRLALVSTGIQIHAEMVAQELGFDRVFCNYVYATDGIINGETRVGVPEGGKGAIVDALLAELGVAPSEALAVGDTRSDADMFRRVGVSVAVCPNHEAARQAASLVLEQPDLTPIVPWLISRGHLTGL
ncbi:MAG: HAD family phosphatase [Chloroflexi bacterium]|nr:HAD family phosphatase [Chloroflexota bacterium]